MSVRYEHYQTSSSIVVSVFRKGAKPEEVDVQIGKSYVRVVVATEEILVIQPLFEDVDVEKSKHRVSPVKIEITLAKAHDSNWTSLTRSASSSSSAAPTSSFKAAVPDSAPVVGGGKKKDWSKIAEEADDKKADTPNDFFAQIFSDATPEARRAMIKSYTESGGTTLSTNWEDVGSRKVEVAPPDGMVQRKWNE